MQIAVVGKENQDGEDSGISDEDDDEELDEGDIDEDLDN